MWRVSLAFATHRAALYLIALIAVNASLAPPTMPSERSLPVVQPFGLLHRHFTARIMEVPEVRLLDELRTAPLQEAFLHHTNPYLWACRLLMGMTGFAAITTVFLLSNLFFFLFLSELYKLLNLIVTTDITRAALLLTIFWPTSYELSLGSQASLICLLTTYCIRKSVDQSWLAAGVSGGLILLTQPGFLFFVPALGALFWFIQRHFSTRIAVVRLVSFVVPMVLAVGYCLPEYSNLFQNTSTSAGGVVYGWLKSGNFSQFANGGNTGQMLSLSLFAVGAVTSLLSHANWFYRVVPLVLLVSVVLGTPLESLASHLLIAAICLEGVASLSSPVVNSAIQSGMWLLGIWEVYSVFR
jgi:hypothetical protein